jgi:hypothetical protein
MTNGQMDEWHASRKDQLPWQVIMIGDPEMVRNLESHCVFRARRARDALRRRSGGPASSSPHPPPGRVPGVGGSARASSSPHPPPELTAAAAAAAAGATEAGAAGAAAAAAVSRLAEALGSRAAVQLARNAAHAEAWADAAGGAAVDYAAAAALYAAAADAATSAQAATSAAAAAAAAASGSSSWFGRSADSRRGNDDAPAVWAVAALQVSGGRCWRRSRDARAAKALLAAGLAATPQAVGGLHELALCHLDSGDYDGARALWEEVSALLRPGWSVGALFWLSPVLFLFRKLCFCIP